MKIKLVLEEKNTWSVYRDKKLIGTIWEENNGLEKEWESEQTGMSWSGSDNWTLAKIAKDLNGIYQQYKYEKRHDRTRVK